jgi:UDP-GlcNAc:undecaprenyl-phosphate GlcNAc-1-phosphate transferase
VFSAVFAVVVSLVAGLLLTPLARMAAVRAGLISRPVSDRWHQEPTAMLGGVAVGCAAVLGVLATWFFLKSFSPADLPATIPPPLIGVAVSALMLFAVGIFDDIAHLRAQPKFVLQLVAGVALVSFGAVFQLTPWYLVNIVLTLFWFVAVTNAVNLLDNMDGVAAGVTAIASLFLGFASFSAGSVFQAAICWCITGAALGFLFYNFNPASIFMGDAGSLFLGACLAGLAVCTPNQGTRSVVSVLFVPLSIVAVPILDTVLVTVTRTLAGRAISQGGRDHSTHRLVALGLSERYVALLLYTFAAIGGLVALTLTDLDRGVGLLVGAVFLVCLSLFAAYLGRLRVYQSETEAPQKAITLLVANLLYKKRLAEILLDSVLIAVAFYCAFLLRFDGAIPPAYVAAFQTTLGVAIAARVAAFALFGVYQSTWEYAGILELYRILAGVALSTVAIFAYVSWRAPLLAGTRSILIIDALVAAAIVLFSRLSFRSLELLRKMLQFDGNRVLVYGAGAAGELLIRELLNNRGLKLHPVCIIDDDTRKHGTRLHGIPVIGGAAALPRAIDSYRVSTILIGTKKLPATRLASVRSIAAAYDLELSQMDIRLNAIQLDAAGMVPAASERVRPEYIAIRAQ